ncbi:hypothetical protein [Streptomyces sp. NPDC008150]|uniref:hypothetical protein n=1 Tax=Streptomyces sp. NPDC008150 TaxID=3364816 RepID=UPI0036E88946
MPGRTWEPTKKGAKQLNAALREGMTVYTVRNVTRALAPYEDPQLYSAHTFDWCSPVTGHWMAGHLSAAGLLGQEGTVYENPPRGMRDIATPGPQVAGPLGNGDYEGVLDEAELRGLEKQAAQGSNPRARRRPGGWRV